MAEVGRPSKMTPETIGKLEEVFAIDGTVEEACFYANINRDTYYTWIKDNKELSDRFEALRNRPVLKARQAVVKGLDNFDNGLKYLERKRKLEFSTRQELDHTTQGEKITEINYIIPNADNDNSNEKTTSGISSPK